MIVDAERKILPSNLFLQAIDDVQDELRRQKAFLEESILDPKKLFVDGHTCLNSTRNIIFQVMSHWRQGSEKIIVHDFQSFLASLVDVYVQQWASEQGLPGEVRVQVRKPNTFPSMYGVYSGDTELIQFDILEKYYGVREPAETEKQIREEYRKRDEEHAARLGEIEKQIAKFTFMKDHGHAYVRNHYRALRKKKANLLAPEKHKRLPFLLRLDLRWLLGWKSIKMLYHEVGEHVYVFFKQKTMRAALDQRIRNLQIEIERQNGFEDRRIPLSVVLRAEEEKKELTNLLTPLFESNGYRLETERYHLY